MRWELPVDGQQRVVKCFAWKPAQMTGTRTVIWMEKYYALQSLVNLDWVSMKFALDWAHFDDKDGNGWVYQGGKFLFIKRGNYMPVPENGEVSFDFPEGTFPGDLEGPYNGRES